MAEDARALAQIEDELRRRDGIDSTRETAPLRIPDGATIIKTEGNTLDETVAEVVEAVRVCRARAARPGEAAVPPLTARIAGVPVPRSSWPRPRASA